MKQKHEVNFFGWIERGFNLYKDNFGLMLVVVLVGGLLSFFTNGILAGPMSAGIILVTLGLLDKREPKPKFEDLFKGFDFFLQSFLFVLIWATAISAVMSLLMVLMCFGWFLALAVFLTAPAFLMFGMFFIADKKMNFWPASVAAFNLLKENPLPLLGISILAVLLAEVGFFACLVGMIFTAPICVCIMAVVYRDLVKGGTEAMRKPGAAPKSESPPQA